MYLSYGKCLSENVVLSKCLLKVLSALHLDNPKRCHPGDCMHFDIMHWTRAYFVLFSAKDLFCNAN
jgi:hypothetical protein